MRRWRRVIGTLLILAPLFVLICSGLLGVLLGSMGMDIHWTSKAAFYVAITSPVLLLCTCVATGIRLLSLQSPKAGFAETQFRRRFDTEPQCSQSVSV
jgi:hypothetical protein